MTTPPRRCIATSAWFAIAALCAGAAVAAPPAGTVTQLSGPLFAQGAGGRIKVLSTDSIVQVGDTLVSGSETFGKITFADRGTVTLGPDTQLSINAFSFDEAKPAEDRAELALAQGALQVAGGAIAKRSAPRQKLKTPLGIIDGVDATFIVRYSTPDAETVAAWAPVKVAALSTGVPIHLALTTPVPGAKSPGLYVQVLDGMIHLTNGGGSQSFAAGQFGYTASFVQPPVLLPANPGMQFTPPPMFSSSPATGTSSSSSGKSNTVDCEVR
jgi:hypothetical protein